MSERRDGSMGIESWRRLAASELRERKLALARARQLVLRAEQIEQLLLAERGRRDASERERRGRGELPDFARERMNALLERAIERAAEKSAAARRVEGDHVERLRESRQRAAALDRLVARRAAREAIETRRAEQKELDEAAARRLVVDHENWIEGTGASVAPWAAPIGAASEGLR
jgi:flagellar biosynthesis chaperone FliJ